MSLKREPLFYAAAVAITLLLVLLVTSFMDDLSALTR
jgi:hypothetical protein